MTPPAIPPAIPPIASHMTSRRSTLPCAVCAAAEAAPVNTLEAWTLADTVAGGAGLVLRNSPWARRRLALQKRRFPRVGDLIDRGLRRRSARRRRERDASR